FTAPYQMDGRESTLQREAQSAIINHSEGGEAASFELERIAEFQRRLFSSPRAQLVAQIQAYGVADEKVPVPEEFFPLTDAQERGRKVYNADCQACHGGATTDRIVKREAVDFLFPALTNEGNVRYE